MTGDVAREITKVFDRAGARVAFHATAVAGHGDGVAIRADEPVVLGSVFKVPIVLALAADADAGRLSLAERVLVDASDRSPGPTGISALQDPIELSLRDLAFLAISVSDNTAADLLLARVGIDRVNALLAALGLRDTRVVASCRDVYAAIESELGPALAEGVSLSELDGGLVAGLSVLDPNRASAGTARELTRLLCLIWNDQAASPSACAEVRRWLEGQVWPHRLASGVPEDAAYAGKTGTLPGMRSEVGVVTHPDGKAYAIAAFTQADDHRAQRPAIDRAIGDAGRIAVEYLRSSVRTAA